MHIVKTLFDMKGRSSYSISQLVKPGGGENYISIATTQFEKAGRSARNRRE